MKKNVKRFMENTIDFWIGYFSMIPEDTPDGAWWQMHIDGFRYSKKNWKELGLEEYPWPKGIDETDLMHAYLEITEDKE